MLNVTAVAYRNDQTIPRRRALFRKWLSLAAAVAHQTRDREALLVATFLNKSATLGLPRADNGLAYLRQPDITKPEAVYIVPMISTDYWLLPADDYWRGYATVAYTDSYGVAEAEYYPPTHAIYLPGEWQRSELQQGIVLLHEGLHAYDHLVRKGRMPKPFWRRERNARLMEMRLLQHIGGAEFITYLDTLGTEVEAQYQSSKKTFLFELPQGPTDEALLDRLLWSANTTIERRARWDDVERYAVIRYFDRRYGARKGHALYGKYVRDNYIGKAHPQHLRELIS